MPQVKRQKLKPRLRFPHPCPVLCVFLNPYLFHTETKYKDCISVILMRRQKILLKKPSQLYSVSKGEVTFVDLSLNLFPVDSEEQTCQQPRPEPFLWPWNPWDWRKLSQVEVTCWLARQVSSQMPLPKANSQKFLYNPTATLIAL